MTLTASTTHAHPLEGCSVRLRTTNGGDTAVNVLRWDGPSYVLVVEDTRGFRFSVNPERIASVEHVR